MSAAFNNIANAARVLASLETMPRGLGDSLLFQLHNLERLNEARRVWYWEEASRKIFDWAQTARLIADFYGPVSPVPLPGDPFSAEEWKELERRAEAMPSGFAKGDYILDRIDTWLLESYRLPGLCEAVPGDIVLDCGTYTGNTSLYFAGKVGPKGHVYGFEPSPKNFKIYARNMRAQANVTPVNAAVYDTCGTLSFLEGDEGSRVGGAGVQVAATALDGFCRERGISRVDFIKMDVEGAELQALNGAREIIQKFTPKMALSAYHKQDDLLTLPALVEDIAPGRYGFRLRHFSNSIFETVLFCIPGEGENNAAAGRRPDPAEAVPGEQEGLALARDLSDFFLTTLYSLAWRKKGLFSGAVVARENSRIPDAAVAVLEEAAGQIAAYTKENEEVRAENLVLRALLEKARRGK